MHLATPPENCALCAGRKLRGPPPPLVEDRPSGHPDSGRKGGVPRVGLGRGSPPVPGGVDQDRHRREAGDEPQHRCRPPGSESPPRYERRRARSTRVPQLMGTRSGRSSKMSSSHAPDQVKRSAGPSAHVDTRGTCSQAAVSQLRRASSAPRVTTSRNTRYGRSLVSHAGNWPPTCPSGPSAAGYPRSQAMASRRDANHAVGKSAGPSGAGGEPMAGIAVGT